MTARCFLLTFLLAALPVLAKPNFTGDWKLNNSKSDFGAMPAPHTMTSKVAHDDPTLKATTKTSSDQGDFDYSYTWTTDGKESTNEFMGNAMKSIAKWDGDALVVNSSLKFGDNDVTLSEKWTLSGDGKTLIIDRTFKSGMGDVQQKLVLEKQ